MNIRAQELLLVGGNRLDFMQWALGRSALPMEEPSSQGGGWAARKSGEP